MLSIDLLALLHDLGNLLCGRRALEVRLVLGRGPNVLDVLLLKVLALVRLRWRREVLLLILGSLILRLRLLSLLLCLLLLLILVVTLLLLRDILTVLSSVSRMRVRRTLGLKSLILGWGRLARRWIASVLLRLMRRLVLLLLLEAVVLLGAVVLLIYPALRVITPTSFGVYAGDWGPKLLLVRIRCKLRRVRLVWAVFRGRLRRVVVVVLQERVQVVLVLLVRGGQVLAGPLPLRPLCRGLQASVAGRLIALWPSFAVPDGDASPQAAAAAVLRREPAGLLLVLAVAGDARDDAAADRLLVGFRLLLLLLLRCLLLVVLLRVGARLRLVGPAALLNGGRVLLCGGRELAAGDVLLGRLLEREVRRVTMARRARRKLLSVSLLGDSLGDLLQRRRRVSLGLERLLCGGLVVHYRRFLVSRTSDSLGGPARARTHQRAPATDGQTRCRPRSGSGSTWTRGVSKASQCVGGQELH
jgi:hypothetical protein